MLIVYGVRKKLKTIRDLGTQECPNCGHTVKAQLMREGGYEHVYYIPVFPYFGTKFISCPCCGIGKKLTGAEFKALKNPEAQA